MARDICIWVGAQFYPTYEEYIEEAERLGCCRKVNHVPKDITIGESKAFLLHREYPEADAYLFGWYTIDHIIKCSLEQQLYDEIWQDAKGLEITIPALKARDRERIPQRGCGGIDPPSYYLVGPDDITMQLNLRPAYLWHKDKKRLHITEPQIAIPNIKHWRGFRYLDDYDRFIIIGDL